MAALALTCGDPSGVGPELAIAAWRQRDEAGIGPFYLIIDPEMLAQRADTLGGVTLEIVTPEDAGRVFADRLPVVPLRHKLTNSPGVPDKANAAGIIEAIDTAVDDVITGRADALVTSPISKKPLYDAGFHYPGHTEYLGHLAALRFGGPHRQVMMIAGPDLKVVPVTIHIPLTGVPAALTREAIVETALVVARDLRTRFGIAKPRLAVAGLNPHAGEEGSMGREEIDVIAPALELLRQEGIDVIGPLPADTMFHARARATYDVALCMYHDQALIPAKTLAFDEAVNVTLGLPFIRTSPDHGTAFDIAGKGMARPDSLIEALKMARMMADADGAA